MWSKAPIPSLKTHLYLPITYDGLLEEDGWKNFWHHFTLKAGCCDWPLHIYALLTFAFVNPFYTVPLGRSVDYNQWLTGNTKCLKYNGKIKRMSGVICTNFFICSFSGWICKGVWHIKCCVQYKEENFPVLSAVELDIYLIEDTIMVQDNKEKFKVACDEDQMMVPFQCNICQFLNICQILPLVGNHTYKLLMLCIKRVIWIECGPENNTRCIPIV